VLRWFVEHLPDQVVILMGSHDAARVMEVAFESGPGPIWPGHRVARGRASLQRTPPLDGRGARRSTAAQRAISGESSGLGRDELRSPFAMPQAEARASLAALLDDRK